jgi:hypothetical protein
MGQGVQRMVAVNATSASLLTVCRQRSAERGPPHGGRREAVTACDLLLVKRVAYAQLAWGREAGRWWQQSYYGITAHYLLPAQRRARSCHMTAGARRSLRVTRRWRGAAQVRGTCPSQIGQGYRQMVAVKATSASLHTVYRQRSAERGSAHDGTGRREAVTECDSVTLSGRSAGRMPCLHHQVAWGRVST